jgi:RNA polymerase sigma-70 factor (ECF subfamily)
MHSPYGRTTDSGPRDSRSAKESVVADDQGVVAGVEIRELEALYAERYFHFVRVATAIVRDEDRAVDAVHDAFAAAIAHREAYRGEGPLEAWVWRMVVNAARRAVAARSRVAPADEARHALDDDAGPLRTAILALPERQRLVLFLRYYADLDYRSIAAALEISPGTVGATLNAAHATLRRALEEVRS